MSMRLLVRLAAATLFAFVAGAAAPAPAVDPDRLAGLEWRLVGPYRGGRAVAVTGVPGRPALFYMGATGGGVWHTTDAGRSWAALADSAFGTGCVGAVAVSPSDPNVVWAGMGEGPIRGNVSHGDGVYRSLDAGRTWKRMGLERTSQVPRVRIHPGDPDIVYVAAQGRVFGPNPERGIYRTRDGGRTWQRILAVNDSTGASDLVMDPSNPRVLYAGFWQVQRTPWSLSSGGRGSSLWKSVDGGDQWTKLTDGREERGLPRGILGKIAVAVCASRPDRVYALIEADDGGLFRSDDAGGTWTRVSDDRRLRQRAWYFTNLAADPKDPDVVWVSNVRLHLSKDGGRTFRSVRTPHPDHHDIWIDPDEPGRLAVATDGGASISLDGGANWSSMDNQPTAQFYHVITDDSFPYRIYGSQQDNSTVSIPHRTTGYGIEREDWWDVGGGESGWIAPRPGEPDVVYAGSYDGYLTRFDRRTRQSRNIDVYPDNPMGAGAEAMKYRFQWTFPILASRHDASVVYAAGNVVFRTSDEGQTWRAISGDLTRDDPAKQRSSGGPITQDNTSVEYYCTVFALAESPRRAGTLWAGSDDGRIHVTTNDGAAWSDVTPKDLPAWSQVNALEASPHDPARAYAAVARYKLDDFSPYIWATRDFGRSWRRLDAGLPADAFVRVVREDPVRPGLLYAGTETGVWVSFDDGARWQSLRRNLPAVPVTDLVVAGSDLVVATQGRAFWVLDDITPLRELTPAALAADAWLDAPRPTVRFAGANPPRDDAGRNPATGAVLRWWLKRAAPDGARATLEILDERGAVLRRFDRLGEVPDDTTRGDGRLGAKVTARAGANRFEWDLRARGASRFDGLILWGGGLDGPLVPPGRYQARLTIGDWTQTRPIEVVKDPRLPTRPEEFGEQYELLGAIRDKLSEAHDATREIRELREQIDAAVARAKRAGLAPALADSAKALKGRLTAVEEALYQTKSRSEQDPLNFPIRLNNKLALLGETVASADARPTDASREVWLDLRARIDEQLARLRTLLERDVAAFNAQVTAGGVPAVAPRTRR